MLSISIISHPILPIENQQVGCRLAPVRQKPERMTALMPFSLCSISWHLLVLLAF